MSSKQPELDQERRRRWKISKNHEFLAEAGTWAYLARLESPLFFECARQWNSRRGIQQGPDLFQQPSSNPVVIVRFGGRKMTLLGGKND